MTDVTPQTWTLQTTIDGPEDAPVLVLGHSLGSSHIMWDELIPTLSQGLRVIRYDLPGHGGSTPPELDHPMTMQDLVSALLRTVDALGVDSFHVAGLSLGGMVALATAEYVPSRVLSCSSMSATPVILPSQAWVDKAAKVRAEGTQVLADETMERWFSPEFRATEEGAAAVERIREAFIDCSDEGYAQCCEVISQTDLTGDLPIITMPTLLVSAENDGGFPWPVAEELSGTLEKNGAHVLVCEVPEARHMSAVEDPGLVASALVMRIRMAD